MTFVDEDPMHIFVDSDNVALWVRVGPVFDQDKEREEPGVWIELQNEYMHSSLEGPVLMSEEEWDELNRKVKENFERKRNR